MPDHKDYLQRLARQEMASVENLLTPGPYESMESIAFIDSAVSTIGEYLTSAADYFNTLKVGNYTPVTVIPGNILHSLNSSGGFKANRELLISVPVGFKGTYADFLPVALEVLPFVEGTEKDLKFVLSRLAQLLNEPDRLKAQSGIKDLAEKIKPVEEKSFNAYRAFFNGQKAQARLGDVYGRSADIESTYVEVNKINVRLSKVDFAAIEEQTHRLAELNQQLVELTKQDDNRMVSGSIVAGLYRMIHALAVQVTLGSMMTHTFTDLSSCLATNVKEIVN